MTLARRAAVSLLVALAAPSVAVAVPGPDSVAVVYNSAVPESADLAQRYQRARAIPNAQLCGLALPTGDTLTLAEFRTQLLDPLRQCLRDGGVYARIESVLLIRGVPLRVRVPVGTGEQRVSLAAALSTWDSTVMASGMPLLGQEPGRTVSCGGSSCYAARYRNPFAGGTGSWSAGNMATQDGVQWQPVLVTMLHGRTYADAARLLDSALMAESMPPAAGEVLLMNGADTARGALDMEYPAVLSGLQARGLTGSRVPFDGNLTGRTLAAFFTGTASLGRAIEGNTFRPGALVDNLTSFGAVPVNFEATGESQVSIARWVAMGVAGVHGTTDEPLNNCFPSRQLVLDYADGATLAEAYWGRLPYLYWQNLVLGDPMAAPYARRPTVRLEGVSSGERVGGARRVRVTVEDALHRNVDSLTLYVDGRQAAQVSNQGSLEFCVQGPAQSSVSLLAVAQLDSGAGSNGFLTKGWSALSYARDGTGPTSCDVAADAGPEASVADAGSSANPSDAGAAASEAGLDGGATGRAPGGCGCVVGRSARRESGWLALGFALGFVLRRRRPRRAWVLHPPSPQESSPPQPPSP